MNKNENGGKYAVIESDLKGFFPWKQMKIRGKKWTSKRYSREEML